ncbi:MAG: efflux family protein [Labilithrix sp.]|nr:efflux family protein [Labilithrix sp.]
MTRTALTAEVRRLAFPAILHSLLQTSVFVVDRIMLGRHGEASLAAMQLGGAIEWSIWSVFAAFEVGTIARVGRHVGAGRPEAARRVARLSVVAALAMGTVLALATPLVLHLLPRIASQASPAAIAEARGYLGVTIAASPLVFLSMINVATLQAGGDTRTPLVIGVFANVLHVALNYVLIPRLGAHGAGISTAVTFALEALAATLALLGTNRAVSLRKRGEPGPRDLTSRQEARQLARIAMPAFLERVLYHLGYLGYVVVIGRLGDASMAANQSLISIESICFLSADGFGIAAAALVAQKLGAERPDEAQRAARIAARDALVLLTIFGVAALALRGVVLPLFSAQPDVVAIGRATIPVLTIAQPFMAVSIVLAQSVRGAGRTREALGVSVVGAIVVRLSATWLFAITLGLGLPGVWLGSTLDWAARSVMLTLVWRRATPRAPAAAGANVAS